MLFAALTHDKKDYFSINNWTLLTPIFREPIQQRVVPPHSAAAYAAEGGLVVSETLNLILCWL